MAKTVALFLGDGPQSGRFLFIKGKVVEAALVEEGYTVRTIDVRKNLPALVAALTPLPDVIFQ